MPKYNVVFDAVVSQYIEIEAEQGPDEEDWEFEDRVVGLAVNEVGSAPFIRGMDFGLFEWDETPPQVID